MKPHHTKEAVTMGDDGRTISGYVTIGLDRFRYYKTEKKTLYYRDLALGMYETIEELLYNSERELKLMNSKTKNTRNY